MRIAKLICGKSVFWEIRMRWVQKCFQILSTISSYKSVGSRIKSRIRDFVTQNFIIPAGMFYDDSNDNFKQSCGSSDYHGVDLFSCRAWFVVCFVFVWYIFLIYFSLILSFFFPLSISLLCYFLFWFSFLISCLLFLPSYFLFTPE